MAEVALPNRYFTVDEYLAYEDPTGMRYEYVDGELYAFAGAGWWHNEVSMNVAQHLRNAAGVSGCRVFRGDTRVRASELVYYLPDVVVTCDPSDRGQLFVNHPCVVVEVLSPSTEATDRREKLLAYRGIAALRSYLIVATDERRVMHHWGGADGAWQREDIVATGRLALPCPATELSLDDIYQDVELTTG